MTADELIRDCVEQWHAVHQSQPPSPYLLGYWCSMPEGSRAHFSGGEAFQHLVGMWHRDTEREAG